MAEKHNQLLLQTEMTGPDKDISVAGRNEAVLSIVLKERMES